MWEDGYMLRLRPYKPCDGKYIVKWITDEVSFVKWCANLFPYPLTVEALDDYKKKYENDDRAWLMTAVDETGIPVGHLLMRSADYEENSIHFGFVIVDSAKRNKGYGKEMMRLAVKYAFEILNVSKATLFVYTNNPNAHNCYKSVGFVDEKFYKNALQYKDEMWDTYNMAITRP